jgi:hypothetical protein
MSLCDDINRWYSETKGKIHGYSAEALLLDNYLMTPISAPTLQNRALASSGGNSRQEINWM